MPEAASINLEFVDQPPPPQRGPGSVTRIDKARARRQPSVVTHPDYIAPDSHRAHGTYVKYVVERCRCAPCRQANREYETKRVHAITRPDQVWAPYVPSGPARAHIAQLRQLGVGLKEIAKISGIPNGALSKLVYGGPARRPPSRRIRKRTADAILNIPLDPQRIALTGSSDRVLIPAEPTWQLLDDLIARGFTKTWIAGQLGHTRPNGALPAIQIRRTTVRASTARAVAALHDRLEGVDPPPRKTRWSQ